MNTMYRRLIPIVCVSVAAAGTFAGTVYAENTLRSAYLAFTSPEIEVTDGTLSWNTEEMTWNAVMPSVYGEVTASGTYDENGVMTLVEDSVGGHSEADLPLIQEIFDACLAGQMHAPLSFSSEEIDVVGGTLSWDENTMEWNAVCPSKYGEVTMKGTYDENGVMTLVEDSVGGHSEADLPLVQEVFSDALNGIFQSAAVDGAVDNALSEAIAALNDVDTKWQANIVDIAKKYDPEVRNHDIIFYGASNFSYWESMEEDLAPFDVQNHAFGGSTDRDLDLWAPYMLTEYEPSYVFFQTGSNDYVDSTAETDELKVAEAMDFKKEMFAKIHEALPDTTLVVMSGILLPGRAEYVDMTLEINDQLKAFCEETDYMRFIDAEALTYDRENGFVENVESLFNEDQIHLTDEARITWANTYMIPVMEELGMPKAE